MNEEDLHDICKRLAQLEHDAREMRQDIERAMLEDRLDIRAVQARLIR
jgi:hypothetical protein